MIQRNSSMMSQSNELPLQDEDSETFKEGARFAAECRMNAEEAKRMYAWLKAEDLRDFVEIYENDMVDDFFAAINLRKVPMNSAKKYFEKVKVKASKGQEVQASKQLGIQLSWVMKDFQRDASDHFGPTAPEKNFRELAPIFAHGESAYGYNKVCPRDEKLHCAIVDAVSETGNSKESTLFLSWVW
jgi:hypothetical protein